MRRCLGMLEKRVSLTLVLKPHSVTDVDLFGGLNVDLALTSLIIVSKMFAII